MLLVDVQGNQLTDLSGLSLQLRGWGETSPAGVTEPEEKQRPHWQAVQSHRVRLGFSTQEHLEGRSHKLYLKQCIITPVKGHTSSARAENVTGKNKTLIIIYTTDCIKNLLIKRLLIQPPTVVHSLFLKWVKGSCWSRCKLRAVDFRFAAPIWCREYSF